MKDALSPFLVDALSLPPLPHLRARASDQLGAGCSKDRVESVKLRNFSHSSACSTADSAKEVVELVRRVDVYSTSARQRDEKCSAVPSTSMLAAEEGATLDFDLSRPRDVEPGKVAFSSLSIPQEALIEAESDR